VAAAQAPGPDPQTITLPDWPDEPHTVGDLDCTEGWCAGDSGYYPRPCDGDNCPGLVHAAFGDENADGDYWLFTKCDVCGESA
jgi:hypothetical protein